MEEKYMTEKNEAVVKKILFEQNLKHHGQLG